MTVIQERTNGGSPSEKGLFKARDGTSIYYEVRGQGQPLIFCYGLTCRREHWRHQIEFFSENYQIITFDYRGHHASSIPSNDHNLTIEWCARDLEDLLDHLKLKGAVCLGHSMGVPVLVQAAELFGDRMHGMVFVCGAVHNPFQYMFYTDRLSSLYQAAATLFEAFPAASAKVWRQFTGRNPISVFLTAQFGFNPDTAKEDDILGYLDGVNRTPLLVFHRLLQDYTRFDGRKILPGIKSPTLVVAGADDCITPLSIQRELVELLPKGELEMVPRGSHNTHTDFPEEVNRRIRYFLDKIGY
jgi:pimeloyl-ACP methyl ester carboxylesterase